jgi:hypothetical protein
LFFYPITIKKHVLISPLNAMIAANHQNFAVRHIPRLSSMCNGVGLTVIRHSQAIGLAVQSAGPQALVQESLNSLSGIEAVSRPATSLPNTAGFC